MTENDRNFRIFDADLGRLAEVLDVSVKVMTQKTALDAFTRITRRTPVDTGRARASWDIKSGSPSDYVPKKKKGSAKKEGSTNLGKGLAGNALGTGAAKGGQTKAVMGEIAKIDGTEVVFVTSALEYMKYLEGGSSSQAPAGMVELTIAELEVEIADVLKQLDP